MAAFSSGEVTPAAATATKIVDAEAFDRRVYLYGDAVRVAFTSASVSTGAKLGSSALGSPAFALPAGQELWVYHSSGGTTVGYLVTNTA